jgi:hypothetical protein
MTIIMYLGRNVKEYEEKGQSKTAEAIAEGRLKCDICFSKMRRHSQYERGIRETGEKIIITVVWCSKCRQWHALLPDFLLQHKHYSGNEIESVIIDSATEPVSNIDTEASEPTVRRWITQICERITAAVSKLKYHFGSNGRIASELHITSGHCYSELEQLLELAPHDESFSGNQLGLANIWLRRSEMPMLI